MQKRTEKIMKFEGKYLIFLVAGIGFEPMTFGLRGRERPFFIYLELFVNILDFVKLSSFSTAADFCDFRLISAGRGTFVAHGTLILVRPYSQFTNCELQFVVIVL